MYLLYDHINAIFIAAAVFLLFVQVQRTGQQTQAETTSYYANRAKTTAFVETLQRDFRNLGAGVDAADPMITDFYWDSTATSYIEFKAALNPDSTHLIDQIKYERTQITGVYDCDSIPCFEVRRSVYNGTAYVQDGGSAATLREFTILLEGEGGTAPVTFDDTRAITIKIAASSPFGEDGMLERTRWQAKLQPPNLLRKNN